MATAAILDKDMEEDMEENGKSKAANIAAALNAKLKKSMATTGDSAEAWAIPRFSTGILSKDVALGGGYPFGRIILEVGHESSAKTTSVAKAWKSIADYDSRTKLHKDFVDPEDFEPCVGVYIDAEGAADLNWFRANGVDVDNQVLIRPDNAISAFDIIHDLVAENKVGLIILDTLNACCPPEVLDSSIGKNHIGVAARRNNQFFTKLVSTYNDISSRGEIGPTLVVINQLREKVGVMFGSPDVIPGGKGQVFYSSIIVRNGSAPIQNDGAVQEAYADCKGRVKKNKTAVPGRAYSYRLCVNHDHPDFELSEVMTNDKEMFTHAVDFGIIDTSDKKAIKFRDITTPTQKAMKERLREDPEVYRQVWRDILFQTTGYKDGAFDIDGGS